ncbi:MauE/DoxX family redox-associated membrane protein [Rothia koreensis]|jgi:hypothetical protein|uniref:MauE/DoxX family redox-associated membrane protein n=1 Tax=Rothia koreensis TaxID=592378 RepID=UPI0037CB86A0
MTAFLAPPMILAVVLGISGISKLRARGSVSAAFEQLGVPPWLDRGWIKRAFPWGEVLLGLVLLCSPGWVAPIAALVAVALFVTYWALIYRALGFDEPVSCNCFGQANAEPVTHWTLWRNTAFLLLAVLWFAASFRVSAPGLVARVSGSDLLWILGMAAASGTLFLSLAPGARRAAEARRAAHEPRHPSQDGVGSGPVMASSPHGDSDPWNPDNDDDYVRRPIPGVVLKDSHGDWVALTRLAATRARLLLLVSPGCGSCTEVIRSARTWRDELSPAVEVHLVTSARQEAMEAVVGEELWDSVLYDGEYFLDDLMGMGATPSAVLLGADRLLAGGPVLGREDISAFVEDIKVELEAAPQGPDRGPERS